MLDKSHIRAIFGYVEVETVSRVVGIRS